MPARRNTKKGQRKGGKPGQRAYGKKGDKQTLSKDPLQHVQKFRYLPKALLAAYVNEDGCPFYTGDVDEKTFFKKGHITEYLNKDSCEMFWRPGMALALYASSIDAGVDALTDNISTEGTGKSGLHEAVTFFTSEDGAALRKAVGVLNVGTVRRPSEKEAEKAIKTYVEVLTKGQKELRKTMSRVASFSAKMYLMSMSMLEHVDLLSNKKDWAANVQDTNKQPKAIRAWTKKPEDQKKLLAALIEAFTEKVKKNKPKSKKRAAADSSSDNDDDNDSDSDADDDDEDDEDDSDKGGSDSNDDEDDSDEGNDSEDQDDKEDSDDNDDEDADDDAKKGKAKDKGKKKDKKKSPKKPILKRPAAAAASVEKSSKKQKKDEDKKKERKDTKAKEKKGAADDDGPKDKKKAKKDKNSGDESHKASKSGQDRSDSLEKRQLDQAKRDSLLEAAYAEYRAAMPESAAAEQTEDDIRANFMADNANRIVREAEEAAATATPVEEDAAL